MLIFTRSLRVCLAVEPVDLRKSFEGTLRSWSSTPWKRTNVPAKCLSFPTSGGIGCGLLYWDGTGLWLLTKRLEAGTFRVAEAGGGR